VDKNSQGRDINTEGDGRWDYVVRLQPLDCHHADWRYLMIDADQFSQDGLAPMVAPDLLAMDSGLLPPSDKEPCLVGPPPPWIRATALIDYLQGKPITNPEDFHADPWSQQVLPHIKVKTDRRQVVDEGGYFTEVAVRLHPYWKLVAGISTKLSGSTVRLGGEGHHALLTPLDLPPALVQLLEQHSCPGQGSSTAYVLTPGLAEVAPSVYGLVPAVWRGLVHGCSGGRPLLWGGMSVFQKEAGQAKTPSFLPQRAFVAPGTIYRFCQVPETNQPLLPTEGGNWLKTFQSLNYGTLLWSTCHD